jgi:transposase-like protein
MSKIARDPLYRRHRFPAEIISHAVWLYFRFPLSLRMVEDMLAARGIIVSHQTIRDWAGNLDGISPMRYDADPLAASATSGISTRLSSASRARNAGCGAPSIRMASSSTFWCKATGMQRPPGA